MPITPTILVSGDAPLYKQLMHSLRNAIVNRQISVGEMLPTENELMGLFGVSKITVRHAIQGLEIEGLVRRARPKGTIVIDDGSRKNSSWNFASLEDIVSFGEQTTTRIKKFANMSAPKSVAEVFGFKEGTELPCIQGIRFENREPIGEYFIWLSPSIASQINRADLGRPTVFSVIESRLGIPLVEAEQTVWSEPAGSKFARELKVSPKLPVLTVCRIYLTHRRVPVEVAISRFRGDRYRLKHVLTKQR